MDRVTNHDKMPGFLDNSRILRRRKNMSPVEGGDFEFFCCWKKRCNEPKKAIAPVFSLHVLGQVLAAGASWWVAYDSLAQKMKCLLNNLWCKAVPAVPVILQKTAD